MILWDRKDNNQPLVIFIIAYHSHQVYSESNHCKYCLTGQCALLFAFTFTMVTLQ